MQLIGGNASNSYHSPPAVLTNLTTAHYLLRITLDGDPTTKLDFGRHVWKMPSLGVALAFVKEETTVMRPQTLHQRPSPTSSPTKVRPIADSEMRYRASFTMLKLLFTVIVVYGEVISQYTPLTKHREISCLLHTSDPHRQLV